MKHILTFIVLSIIAIGLNAQNALIFNNNPYLVLEGGTSATPIYLVINESDQNGIITVGSGGNIISEDEYNYVKWNINNGTGTYTIPFTTGILGATEQKIPLTINIAGTNIGTETTLGSGHLLLSTYETLDDNSPLPDDVTHLRASTGSLDNKAYVVDRFWAIDAQGYATKPAPSLTFGFNDDNTEIGGAANSIVVTQLGAQRFNSTLNHWQGSHSGSNGIWGNVVGSIGARSVTGVNILASEFFRSWTLTDYDHPLPLQLNSFVADCDNASIVLNWEISNPELTNYQIQKSIDGLNFTTIGTSSSTNYESSFKFIDRTPYMDQSYYRLVTEGQKNDFHSEVISIRTCDNSLNTYIFSPLNNRNIYIEFNANFEGLDNKFMLIDLSGKIVKQENLITTTKGSNQFKVDGIDLAPGIYNAVLIDNKGLKTVAKVIL